MHFLKQMITLESLLMENDPDDLPFTLRNKELFNLALTCAEEGLHPTAGEQTWQFEPFVFINEGMIKHKGEFTFKYSFANDRSKKIIAEQWNMRLFTRLAEYLPEKKIWHLLAVQEYQGKKPVGFKTAVCLICTHNLTGDYWKIWKTLETLADWKQPGYQAFGYLEECMKMNELLHARGH